MLPNVGMNRAEVPEQQAGQQRAAGGGQADRYSTHRDAERTDQAADHDAAGHDRKVGGLDGAIRMADRLHRSRHVSLAPAESQHVATQYLHLRQHGQLDEVAGDLA